MSSSLTIALAALGGVVLAAVVAHGAWQARKVSPRRAAEPMPPRPPADTPREMREPVLDPITPVEPPTAAPQARPPRRPSARLDALIDAIAPLTIEAPIAGDVVLMHLPTTRRAGSKPFLIEGLNASTGEWEAPAPGERYGEFQAGVQLANRTGALNEIEYSEFVQKVEAFAEAIGAMADFPDMLDVVARARELDAFAGEHDAQLAVHLQARSAAWSVGYIQQHASRHGFVAGVVPGRLVLPSAEEGAPPVLTLTFDSQAAFADDPNRAAVRDVTLSFDVPQTDPAAEPFVAWQASAQALSLGMDAAIVDDHARPLSPQGFASIGGELGALYETLQARDLAAGSPAARRLFS
ncbi:MAG TPA: cell division protein FtsZ [Albitalea sp.]|uniref:cell division protein FtsZ n=1 Tax=Piscinibacter sp. TaxID=1903157 RepID=UPI002ED1869C